MVTESVIVEGCLVVVEVVTGILSVEAASVVPVVVASEIVVDESVFVAEVLTERNAVVDTF